MASIVAENWEYLDVEGSENLEFSQVNHNILMSLLDETQIDDCDDERLENVIQSLEAEISSGDQYELNNTTWECDLLDCQSSIDESNDLQQNEVDLHWMDLETLPTSPGWYMDSHGQGMVGGLSEFGWFKNYANAPFEEQDHGSLWHDTDVTM